MEYKEHIVAFIDILGFKNIVNSGEYKPEGISLMLKFLRNEYTLDGFPHSDKIKPKLTVFSDNIFISYEFSKDKELIIYEDVIHRTSIMQAILFSYGILTRGSLTKGLVVHNETECFGPAIVRAAELESSVAIYPRIICDNNLNLDLFLKESRLKKSINKTELEMYFINFFSFLLIERLSAFTDIGFVSFFDIRSNLYKLLASTSNTNLTIRAKHIWLIKQWNIFIENMIKHFNPKNKQTYYDYIIEIT